MRRFLALCLLATLAAGCVHLEEPPPRASSAPAPSPARAPVVFGVPENERTTPVPVALALDEAWLKPLEAAQVRAEADASSFSWYAAIVGARTRVTYVDGVPWLLDADASHRGEASGPSVRPGPTAPSGRLDTGLLAPGAPPVPVRFEIGGRYQLGARDGSSGIVNVTVAPGVRAAEAFVTLRDGRFLPSEVEVRPGGLVSFFNDGRAPAGATIRQAFVPLEGSGPRLSVGAVDEGVYEVVAIARSGADGRGVASARFLSDFERPARSELFGPWSGQLSCLAEPACDEERHAAKPRFPIRLAFLNVTVGSPLPGGAVAAVLTQDGKEIARLDVDRSESFILRDLPQADLKLAVRTQGGALVAYHAALDVVYRLPAPPLPS